MFFKFKTDQVRSAAVLSRSSPASLRGASRDQGTRCGWGQARSAGEESTKFATRFATKVSNSRSGITLVEQLIGMGVGAIVIVAVCNFALFNARSFVGLASYAKFDTANRAATDQMTKDFRMVFALTNYTSNMIILADYDGTPLTYRYNPTNQTLKRIKGTTTNLLLTECRRFSFIMNMRNMTNGTFDYFPTTNTWECKAITANWCCSRTILGKTNDDMPQSETIVTRN